MYKRTVKFSVSFYLLFLNMSTVIAADYTGKTFQDGYGLEFYSGDSNRVVNSKFLSLRLKLRHMMVFSGQQ